MPISVRSASGRPGLARTAALLPVFTACLLALGAARAQGTGGAPVALALEAQQARIQWGGPGLGQNTLFDPWFVATPGTAQQAEASVAAGLVRGLSTDATNPGGVVAYAYANLQFTLRNTGAAPASFAAGAIAASFDAQLMRVLGPDAYGTSSHLVIGTLTGLGGGLSAGSGFSLSVAEGNFAGAPRVDFKLNPHVQGFTATGSGDAAGLAVDLAFPAFTLAPGASLQLGLGMQTTAHAYDPGSTGWSALTDAFHSAHLSMLLPAGSSVASAQPLAWVTVVPEPPSAALLLVALPWLARRLRRTDA